MNDPSDPIDKLERQRAWVRASLKKRRAKLKSEGICVRCGKVPARPERVLCQSCATQAASAGAKCKRNRASVRRSLKKRRKRLKDAGICVDCGKVPARPERTLCQVCADDRNARRKRSAKHKPSPRKPSKPKTVDSMMRLVDRLVILQGGC